MSGPDVIGGIAAVIAIIDTSIKIYDSAQKDIKLSETFDTVGRRLPIILDTLKTCESDLKASKDTMSRDACRALEKIVGTCDEKAGELREIFEKTIPGEKDKWQKRYFKVVRRIGKGNKVEDLMIAITQDVQLIVNKHAVNSASPEQKAKLKEIIEEMESLPPSMPEEESSAMMFVARGGKMTNVVHTGSGEHKTVNDSGRMYNADTINIGAPKQKEDFSFRLPVGIQIGQAPYIASELFVGRCSELDKIAEALRPDLSPRKQRRLVLGGMGGVGKTQLAIAYAESHGGSYSSVFWLNASSDAAVKVSLQSIAHLIFDVQDPGALEGEEAVRRIHQWLSDPKNTEWLLIFDNYDDPKQFKIDRYYPPASHGAIVVTTRRPDLVAGMTIHIQPFRNIKDSLAILETRSKRENVESDAHAKSLAERLAGHPLALATAGTYLRHSAFTFKRYLQEYEKHWNINPRRPVQLQEYEKRTLDTAWDLSYNLLEKEDPDAAKFLNLLAYFGNQSIWFELFHAGLADNSPEWLRGIIADDVNFDGVMGILTEYYFLEVQPMSESWSMHNCVHDWTLAVLNRDINKQHYWYAVDCIDASLYGVEVDSFEHISYSHLAAHATRLVQQRFLRNDIIASATVDRLNSVSRISVLLRRQIQLAAAEKMLLRALAGYEKALGADHTLTLDTVNNLGLLYRDQDKLDKAEQMFLRALAGYEKALGADHTSALDTVNNLGLLYRDQDKLDKAEQMFLRALAGYEKALGADHTSTLDTVNNLGVLYRNQGKLDEAEQIFLRALAGYEKALGADYTSALSSVNNLGLLYRDQDKLDKAEQMFLRALAGYKKALGADHTSTLGTIDNLGNLYRDQDKLDKAEQMFLRALAGYKKALGAYHTSTLDHVNNIGLLYRDQDKLDKAEQICLRALARYEQESTAAVSRTRQ